jgi:hypothetical protein
MSENVSIDHAPARLSVLLALGAALVAALMISFSSVLLAVPIGVVAVVLAGLGLAGGYRTPVGVAVGILFFGLMLTGMSLGASVEVLLAGTLACILTWDLGENAISIGRQLSRDSRTIRIEGVHAATSTAVGVVGTGLAYGIFRTASGGKPLPALFFMLLGVVLLGWQIRR